MNNLADFKSGRASDDDGDIAAVLVLIIDDVITLGYDAPGSTVTQNPVPPSVCGTPD